MRRVTSQPADLPKIDWSYYKNKISIPGMVETYKKGYESLNIPYPSDQGLLAKVDQLDAKYKEAHKQNMSNIKQEMLRLQEELKKLEAQMPYSEMNMEEFFVACPEHAINHDKPELYPHGEKDSSEKSDGHH